MSLIQSDQTAPPINELPSLMKSWMKLQEELALLNAEVKQRRTQAKAYRDMILRIMDANKLATLNVSKGAVVHKVKEVKESLSHDYLLKHCKEFFNGDEEKAKSLLTYLEEHRESKVKHDLRIVPGSGNSDGGSSRSR
jgi:hypothetical protein